MPGGNLYNELMLAHVCELLLTSGLQKFYTSGTSLFRYIRPNIYTAKHYDMGLQSLQSYL